MGHHGFSPNSFRRYTRPNKRKVILGLLLAFIVFVVLISILLLVAAFVLKAVLGQADSGLGQTLQNVVKWAWDLGLGFIRSLWQQVIANPLQFLTGNN